MASRRFAPQRALPSLVLAALATTPLRAQAPRIPSNTDPRPVAIAARRDAAISVDGRLDEAAWSRATPITEFLQLQPNEGQPASQRTDVRILYDNAAIYVGARMYDSTGAAGVRAVLARHDQLLANGNGLTSDALTLIFDTFRDGNSQARFYINPRGVKGESQDGDATFDPVWDAVAHVDSLGWVAEMRIPLSQLRFSSNARQSWGLQVQRTVDRLNETDLWAFHRVSESASARYFGKLDGIQVAERPRQMELVPYVTSRHTFKQPPLGDPFHSARSNSMRVGGDFKYLLNSNLTLNATVNPDFGQVEVDPAVVNLSAFETTFQERRPFFVSDARYFAAGGLSCHFCMRGEAMAPLYTRRIGRSPQLSPLLGSRARFMDAPDATPIAGAFKITGTTANGTSIGVMDAITDRQMARFVMPNAVDVRKQEVEPLTNYFATRVRHTFGGGTTRIGAIGTLVNRALSDDDEIARLRSSAAFVGVDFDHTWHKGEYVVNGMVAGTSIRGDTGAIRRTQETSARYYQRPGRGAVSDGLFDATYDPTRRSLNGYAAYARLGKDQGDWIWETQQSWRSPGYETNDLGTTRRADSKWMNASLGRVWNTPNAWRRNAYVLGEWEQELNYERDRVDYMYHLTGSVTLPNYHTSNFLVMYQAPVVDARLTRGGPSVRNEPYMLYNTSYSTDSRKSVVGRAAISADRPIGASEWHNDYGSIGVTYKPSTSTSIAFTPSLSRSVTGRQYVTSIVDPLTPAGFAGRRYVFARIEQRAFDLATRINASFTPTLTLELYADPFFASGHYSSFREFQRPGTNALTIYGRDGGSTITPTLNAKTGLATSYRIDPDGAGAAPAFNVTNPDFTLRSLRGTSVVRWEYRPGSTLFLVWTQTRDGSDAFGNLSFQRDRAALFADRPTNIFQVKVAYWLGH